MGDVFEHCSESVLCECECCAILTQRVKSLQAILSAERTASRTYKFEADKWFKAWLSLRKRMNFEYVLGNTHEDQARPIRPVPTQPTTRFGMLRKMVEASRPRRIRFSS